MPQKSGENGGDMCKWPPLLRATPCRAKLSCDHESTDDILRKKHVESPLNFSKDEQTSREHELAFVSLQR
ncbi:RHOMBOID-like protein 3 [Clarias magur]|uniref:RHOMBOID-like protein 3 n=1 Tax=Clarias magur TaxID=1594786 RepID=A0A8J4TWF2_CLAMG|nr:RHOMBOID-like protein 3 [Clarias magur]